MKIIKGKIDFGDFSGKQNELFYKKLEDIEAKVRALYVTTGVENAGEIFDSSLNMGEIIRSLPKVQGDGIMREYRTLIDFERVVSMGTVNKFENRGTEKGLGKFNVNLKQGPDGELNPLSVIYNRMTLNEHYRTKEWQSGSNILRAKHIKELTRGIPKLEAGKSVLVFDTETASLGLGNVREIAAFRVETGAKASAPLVVATAKPV